MLSSIKFFIQTFFLELSFVLIDLYFKRIDVDIIFLDVLDWYILFIFESDSDGEEIIDWFKTSDILNLVFY